MSDDERSPTPLDEIDHADNGGNNNGAQNGDEYGGHSPKESRRRRSSSEKDKARSRSGSRSRNSKKHRSHRRSRSRSRDRRSHRKRSPSRSRSRSPVHDRRRRHSRSPRSPSYGRPRFGAREAPPPSRCLGVFGMSMYTDEKQLERYFSQFGKIEAIQIVYDRKTRRSRGFAFVYFDRVEDAKAAKDKAVGTEIDGQRVRIDFSITEAPHAPTPGMYMGRRRDGPEEYGRFRGGGSPSYRRRSRSNSYSPRR